MPRDGDITIENARIVFRNFEGREDTYNHAGDRNFAVLLDEPLAVQMHADGWNVKRLKPRDDEPLGTAYISVAVSFKGRPPKLVLITKKNMTYLGESEAEMLDFVDIETADVVLSPYDWNVGGKSGRRAYATSVYIRIVEDYLEEKWKIWIEDQQPETAGQADMADMADDYELAGVD